MRFDKKKFATLRDVGMLVEEKLSSTNATYNWKGYQNKNQKSNGNTSKENEVDALTHYAEYTTMGTKYTQALERLLSKGKIELPPITSEREEAQNSKSRDESNYCRYHRT